MDVLGILGERVLWVRVVEYRSVEVLGVSLVDFLGRLKLISKPDIRLFKIRSTGDKILDDYRCVVGIINSRVLGAYKIEFKITHHPSETRVITQAHEIPELSNQVHKRFEVASLVDSLEPALFFQEYLQVKYAHCYNGKPRVDDSCFIQPAIQLF